MKSECEMQIFTLADFMFFLRSDLYKLGPVPLETDRKTYLIYF
jgi:hypothetical protein